MYDRVDFMCSDYSSILITLGCGGFCLGDSFMLILNKISEECFQHFVGFMSQRMKAGLMTKGGPSQ